MGLSDEEVHQMLVIKWGQFRLAKSLQKDRDQFFARSVEHAFNSFFRPFELAPP